ncbi:diacylglycerol kinase, partial [Bowmanella sp. Y57]|nr:diacylglycerol kinase [Bowmanella yangjiangensis]
MSEAPDLDALSFKGRSGLTRILNATGYSLAGLRAAYRGEAAFRQLVWLNLVLL